MEYPGSLHNHTQMSNFRLRDCIIRENELLDRAIELGHEVVAITDHETIAAALNVEEYYTKLKEKGTNLQVILGNEIYLCRDGLNNSNFIAGQDKYYHFILLAKDREGFKQLCELSTRAWMRSYMGRGMRRVPTYYSDIAEIITKNPGHVIGSTACLGSTIGQQLLLYKKTQDKDLWNKILKWCKQVQSLFGEGDFYLELQPSATMEQTYVNRQLIEISKILDIPYIITTDSHYLKLEDRGVHKAFLNSQDGEREIDAFYATTYLMNTQELEEHLELTREELDKAYLSIKEIKNKCSDYSLLKPLNIPTLPWKDYSQYEVTKDWIKKIPMFQTFLDSDYVGDKELVRATIAGIEKHKDLQCKEAYDEINDNLRITWESSEVNKAHWSAYYLNLQKIIDLCWEAGSLVGPGRGSGVGFLLLYALDIIQINPLRENTQTFSWRFLNPERVSVLDVDFDIEGGRRDKVLSKFREVYGRDRIANVLTLKTEKSKSAILTACRGLGIDIDEAQYIASFIPSDRGKLRTLSQVFCGDKDKGFKPVEPFVNLINNDYSEVWEVAQKIEGLVNGCGIHAGGVIFVDEPFTESTALMRAPNGTICTQFDLHMCEKVSLIKYDALSVEAMDKLHVCLDLLIKDNKIIAEPTLRETYEKVLGIYNLERTDKRMWQMIWEHKVQTLFQMEKQSGVQGIALIKPVSVDELAVLNSVIRLMAPDGENTTPVELWAKYRKDINLWYEEMRNYGLTEEEIKWLASHSAVTDGICESQEGLMSLVQEQRLGGNSLTFADKVRKGVAKKQGKLFEECEQIFYENIKKNNCSETLAHYVWDVLLRVQRGYSFNRSHCLAYSLVGLQEMNLAFKFPLVYWDCACLIVDSGSTEFEDNNEEEQKTTSYGKMAKAMGNIMAGGTKVSMVDINNSKFSFEPDIEHNQILFGMKGLNKCGDDVIEKIIEGRPYNSFQDFLNRCKVDKSVVISLIKAGAFDNLDDWYSKYGENRRYAIMAYYLSLTSEPKKRLTLQNMNGLINNNLIPPELDFEVKVYHFNKFLKTQKNGIYYNLASKAADFYSQCDPDLEDLEVTEGLNKVEIKKWDKRYKKLMDKVRNWLSYNQQETLNKLNYLLFKAEWDKYAKGNLSAWEMESMCFYYHQHELKDVNLDEYGICNFKDIPARRVERYWKRGGREIPIYYIYKIIGTVIDKDSTKSTVVLLTTDGVVNVKLNKEYFAMFNKRISELNPETNKKEVKEQGWFTRGTKLMFMGVKNDENNFRTKTYKNTAGHQIYKITSVDKAGHITLTHHRYQGGELEEYE